MVRLVKYSVLLAFASVLVSPALAQSPIQLRFNVQPAASDPIWQSFKGQTLEKEAECYYSTDTVVPKLWPQGKAGTFKAKTVLFNPGATTWSGGKQVFTPNTPPEPTNTLLMLPVGFTAQTKSIVCRTSILLNGRDISASARSLVFGLVADIAKVGPPTSNITLDTSKIAQSPQAKELPKAKSTTEKDKPTTFSFIEYRFAGTGIVITASPNSSAITVAELEKTSGTTIAQKYPVWMKKACEKNDPKSKPFCAALIEITLKRTNSIGALKVYLNQGPGYFNQNANEPPAFPSTVEATFPAGVDTIKVVVERGMDGNPKDHPGGLCTKAQFYVAAFPQQVPATPVFDSRSFCIKP